MTILQYLLGPTQAELLKKAHEAIDILHDFQNGDISMDGNVTFIITPTPGESPRQRQFSIGGNGVVQAVRRDNWKILIASFSLVEESTVSRTDLERGIIPIDVQLDGVILSPPEWWNPQAVYQAKVDLIDAYTRCVSLQSELTRVMVAYDRTVSEMLLTNAGIINEEIKPRSSRGTIKALQKKSAKLFEKSVEYSKQVEAQEIKVNECNSRLPPPNRTSAPVSTSTATQDRSTGSTGAHGEHRIRYWVEIKETDSHRNVYTINYDKCHRIEVLGRTIGCINFKPPKYPEHHIFDIRGLRLMRRYRRLDLGYD